MCVSVQFSREAGSGSGFSSWKTVPAVPVPRSVPGPDPPNLAFLEKARVLPQKSKGFTLRGTPKILGKGRRNARKSKENRKKKKARKSKKARIGGSGGKAVPTVPVSGFGSVPEPP